MQHQNIPDPWGQETNFWIFCLKAAKSWITSSPLSLRDKPPTSLHNSLPSITYSLFYCSPSFRMPHSRAIYPAVTMLSPVIMRVVIPAFCRSLILSVTPGLRMSFTPKTQIKVKPFLSISLTYSSSGSLWSAPHSPGLISLYAIAMVLKAFLA